MRKTNCGWRRCAVFLLIATLALRASAETPLPSISGQALARQLQVGDLVFIRVAALPFRKVASATNSWTNHVGIVVATEDAAPVIAESTFPLSKQGSLQRFLARSEGGRVEVSRLNTPLNTEQQQALVKAARARMGIFYDTGFDLHSRGQICSRFVREVLHEANGVQVGQVETFATLVTRNPEADQAFWRLWYFGNIPWQRETITPASIMRSEAVHPVFDGQVTADQEAGQRQHARSE